MDTYVNTDTSSIRGGSTSSEEKEEVMKVKMFHSASGQWSLLSLNTFGTPSLIVAGV